MRDKRKPSMCRETQLKHLLCKLSGDYCEELLNISLNTLKGPKREKLHAMHVKELIKTNYFER